MLNVYNGTVTTDGNGEAAVALPGYFNALNHQCCYQLTVIGQFAQAIVAKEVGQDNQFTIKTSEPRVTVSWQVTGSGRTHGRSRTALRRRPRRPLRNGDATCIPSCGANGTR